MLMRSRKRSELFVRDSSAMLEHVQSRTGTIFCLASGAAFGAMAVFGKLSYDEGVNVGTLLSVRFVLGGLLFWVIARVTGATSQLRELSRRDLLTSVALGAFG